MSHSPGLRPSFCDPNLAFAFFPAYPISPMAHPLHDTTINTMHMDSSSSATTNNSHPHHRPRKSISSYTRPMTRRTIFIQNLSASTTPTDLETFLQQSIGTNVTTSSIEQTEMPLDAETGCCKGFARVTFHQTEEAKRAVTMCNNAIFMGAKIRVKIDRSIHVRYSLAQGPTSLPESSPGIVAPESSGAEMKLSAAGARRESAPTQVDRCQPLVVNGSGIGRRVVAT
ncbi:hypothetical protein EYZ11_003211 [Aspergillus tanneri]|nr:hypothetical protein EYZ11_003211 [Aspergillus tanneri]